VLREGFCNSFCEAVSGDEVHSLLMYLRDEADISSVSTYILRITGNGDLVIPYADTRFCFTTLKFGVWCAISTRIIRPTFSDTINSETYIRQILSGHFENPGDGTWVLLGRWCNH
jgi:hypothetical protein